METKENEKIVRFWTEENKILQKKGYFDYVSRLIFNELFSELEGKKVLDVGCGLGMGLEYFRSRGAEAFGIDICHDNLLDVKGRGFEALIGDARSIPFQDNTFDLVYSLGVVEHFHETVKSVREHVRVCRPGGTILVVVPNSYTPYVLAGRLFYWLSYLGREVDMLTTYGKTFSPKKLKSMLVNAGCESDVEVRAYYGSAFLRVFPRLYKKTVDLIESLSLSRRFGLVLFAKGIKAK